MGSCSCQGTLMNSGGPACDSYFGIVQRQIAVPILKNDGVTRNYIDPSVAIDSAYVTARLNATDGSRWYPLPLMKNITDERAEVVTEQFNDQSKFRIRQGARTFSGLIVKYTPHYLAKLMEYSCVDFGLYEVDEVGNIRGEREEDGFIYPIRVEKGSWDPRYVKTTDSTIEKIMVMFDYAQSVKDEMLEMIPASEITVNLLTINGLFDVHYDLIGAAPGQTGFTVDFHTDFGPITARTRVTGLLVTDFFSSDLTTASSIWNVTDGAAVTLTSVTESTSIPGRYAFVYASQTVADVLRMYPKKNGYDFTEIYDEAHDLPAIV